MILKSKNKEEIICDLMSKGQIYIHKKIDNISIFMKITGYENQIVHVIYMRSKRKGRITLRDLFRKYSSNNFYTKSRLDTFLQNKINHYNSLLTNLRIS